jgi:hypothetical protein
MTNFIAIFKAVKYLALGKAYLDFMLSMPVMAKATKLIDLEIVYFFNPETETATGAQFNNLTWDEYCDELRKFAEITDGMPEELKKGILRDQAFSL